MIDSKNPDFLNTPASDQRPASWYQPTEPREPILSVITPYYNTGAVFWDTVRCLQRQSIPYWEWLIVDDGTTDASSLDQLRSAAEQDPRIRILRQQNGGPGVARNLAAREARGKYLLLLDSDDMVEPTFAEKAIWFLETQPTEFAAVTGYNVTFGSRQMLWPYGFDRGSHNVHENYNTVLSVVRRSDFLAVGGFDESVSFEHADWDFWLNLAEVGQWGYTIPEYSTWYRTHERSMLTDIEGDRQRAIRFREWLHNKHRGLEHRFPQVTPLRAGVVPDMAQRMALPFQNPLAKAAGEKRLLLIAPWLEVGGADRFNLDMLRELGRQGYSCTVATTLRDDNPLLHEFTQLTSDVFCLHNFLALADHPRFLSYLIESRQPDVVMVSNSAFGYALLPYLRARHPNVPLVDYTHMEEPDAPHGGYPGLSAQAADLLDRRLTNTEHLKAWMVERGAAPASIDVRRCGVDVDLWQRRDGDGVAVRAQYGVRAESPLIVFVGRLVAQKQPMVFGEIVARLAERGLAFEAIVAGSGEDENRLKLFLRRRKLDSVVRLVGVLTPQQVRALLSAADFLLLPSQQEGLAIVLMESMAMGVIPVTADVGGQRELVSPEAGILVSPGPRAVDAYVDALGALLAEGAERRAELARAARAAVVAQFNLAQLGAGLDESFQRAITDHAASSNAQRAPDLARALSEAERVVREMAHEDAEHAAARVRREDRLVVLARTLREVYMPTGSRRFNTYKALRGSLRGVRRRMRTQ